MRRILAAGRLPTAREIETVDRQRVLVECPSEGARRNPENGIRNLRIPLEHRVDRGADRQIETAQSIRLMVLLALRDIVERSEVRQVIRVDRLHLEEDSGRLRFYTNNRRFLKRYPINRSTGYCETDVSLRTSLSKYELAFDDVSSATSAFRSVGSGRVSTISGS